MPSIERVLEHAVTLLGGGALVWLLTAWRDARREKAQEPAELARAFAELGETLSGSAGHIMGEFRKEFTFLRGRVVELQGEVDRGRAEIVRLNLELAASKSEHADCRALVNRYRAELDERLGQLPLLPYETAPKVDA